MSSKPLVTVLIDTYNHQQFIGEAIRSVLGQEFPASEMEILAVDDGSTDQTADIVREFAPRVRLIRKSNGGQASAFNAGIPQARGELVAFLDGDDWWAPGKLKAVTEAFASEPELGLVGHGVTEVYPDRSERIEVLRESSRFRISSADEAKRFRMRRGFLGTSRMTCRRELLLGLGRVPEALKFEADEYLFTLAGLAADVLVLPHSFTFYRLHDKNLFQLARADDQATRRKQEILVALAESLGQKFIQLGVPKQIARTVLEAVEVEADLLRLGLDSGYPWETVGTELKILRIFHSDATVRQLLFSCLRLVPALFLPSRTYYRWRRALSKSTYYRSVRQKLLPFPVPLHVDRRDQLAPEVHQGPDRSAQTLK